MLSRKDYKAIAEIMKTESRGYETIPDRISEKLADYFAQDNPRFDRDRFLAACGL